MKKGLLLLFIVSFFIGCAASPPRRESVTAFRSFDIQGGSPEMLVEAVKTSMAVRADNLTATTGVVPDNLPDKPGNFEVTVEQMSLPMGMSISFPRVVCKNSYSLITNVGGYSGGGSSQSDSYTGCVYPYKDGIRVHIVLVSTTSHGSGLSGMINAAIKESMIGGNKDAAERALDKITEKFTSLVPPAKIVKGSKQGELAGVILP